MRIITGRLKGRRITAPPGLDVRPTSDRLRETIFNVIADTIVGARVLDAFAGTGALGLEAWSRGAASVVLVEREPKVVRVLTANVAACGVAEACAIIRGDFQSVHLPTASFDLVLLDPPYAIDDLQAVMDRAASLVAPGGTVVLEHARRRTSPEHVEGLMRYRVLTAGDSALSWYTPSA